MCFRPVLPNKAYHRNRKQAAIVVKKMSGKTNASAVPTQNNVKSTAARRPTTSPTIKAKMKTVKEKRMNKPSGTPVRAMFIPRKVYKMSVVGALKSNMDPAVRTESFGLASMNSWILARTVARCSGGITLSRASCPYCAIFEPQPWILERMPEV